MKRFGLFAALALAACSTALRDEAPLVGTWRLVEYWNADTADSVKRYPFGEHPLGVFVYDRWGNVMIQIAKNPQAPRVAKDALKTLGADELRAMLEDYVAYFGTYTIDAARGIVTHHVTADVKRDYTGTDQPRPFQLHGDELVIGDGKTWLRRLVRVR